MYSSRSSVIEKADLMPGSARILRVLLPEPSRIPPVPPPRATPGPWSSVTLPVPNESASVGVAVDETDAERSLAFGLCSAEESSGVGCRGVRESCVRRVAVVSAPGVRPRARRRYG